MCAYTQVCIPLRRGQTQGGWYVRQSQIPLAWEGWVAQPVDRSQAFTGRVPTSGQLGGTAFLCMLCSSLFGIPRTRVIDVYTDTLFWDPKHYLPTIE